MSLDASVSAAILFPPLPFYESPFFYEERWLSHQLIHHQSSLLYHRFWIVDEDTQGTQGMQMFWSQVLILDVIITYVM